MTSICDELGLGVPKQIQENIWNSEYVDLCTLLRPVRGEYVNNTPQDCVLLIGSTEPPTWQIRPPAQHTRIASIEQWTLVFLVFASIYLFRHFVQAKQLLKYADTLSSAAFYRAGYGWRDYDIQFRLRQARMLIRSWASISTPQKYATFPWDDSLVLKCNSRQTSKKIGVKKIPKQKQNKKTGNLRKPCKGSQV